MPDVKTLGLRPGVGQGGSTPSASARLTITTEPPLSSPASTPSPWEIGRLLAFGVIALEFALTVVAFRLLNIETYSFESVLTLSLGGFVVHHFLPMAWRPTFFGLLSVVSVLIVFGAAQGAWLLGLGCTLIAVCHVPIPFVARGAILAAAAGLLAGARAGALPWVGDGAIPGTVWPILGSMFMFRLLVYLYDLKHRAAPFSPGRALGYFFMLPNVCFALFPVVDYKGFQRSFYAEDALRTYQTGAQWMARGLVQLVLYRWVYTRGVIEPIEIVTGLDAARYMLMTYLLYLKISGLFHVCVGLLHMFGYSLPETHHLYLLASSFTDFWRRINIYWKDFIQKLFFNPSYFGMRRLGDGRAMALATLISFAATWFFHSYQWFWIRGSFPIVWNDLVFWFGLGLIVLVNVLIESRAGRRRSLKAPVRTLKGDATLALKTAATFASICILWTIWSTPSLEELRLIARGLWNSRPSELVVMAAVPLGVGVAGVVLSGRRRGGTIVAPAHPASPRWLGAQAIGVCTIALALILVALRPTALLPVSHSLAGMMRDLREKKLNRGDMKRLQRGYYEDLGDVTRFNDELWAMYAGLPEDQAPGSLSEGLPGLDVDQTRPRDDAVKYDFLPSSTGWYKGVLRTINSRGMRDREYTPRRPPRTYRIALAGSSHDAGLGVRDHETYENLVEDRLNRELGPQLGLSFEVLNFSCDGYGPLQKLVTLERRMAEFDVQAGLLIANSLEIDWTFQPLPHLIRRGLVKDFPFLASALERANIPYTPDAELPEPFWLEYSLQPHAESTLLAIMKRLRAECRSRQVRPALVLLHLPSDGPARPEALDRVTALGREAELPVLDLFGAFSEVEDLKSLWITPRNSHTNATGHRLWADRLYDLLIAEQIVPTPPSVDAERTAATVEHPRSLHEEAP